jgi:hypothetical protein
MPSKLFVSTEVEGRLAGAQTLFVEGLVPVHEIIVAAAEQRIQHVYFGAVHKGRYGTPSAVDPAAVKKVCKLNCNITVEVLHPIKDLLLLALDLNLRLQFMVPAFSLGSWYPTLLETPALWPRLQVKFIKDCSNEIIVVGFTYPTITKPEDYLCDDNVTVAEFA